MESKHPEVIEEETGKTCVMIAETEEGRRLELEVASMRVSQSRDITPVYRPGELEVSEFKAGTPRAVIEGDEVRHQSTSQVVWQNECGLVWHDAHGPSGEMGLCYPEDDREVQVHIIENGPAFLLPKLKGKSVRVTIEVVEGGNI